MAAASPLPDAHAILRAPDLDSAERVYLGLLPDLAHVDALTRHALGATRAADAAARGYVLSMTLVGCACRNLRWTSRVPARTARPRCTACGRRSLLPERAMRAARASLAPDSSSTHALGTRFSALRRMPLPAAVCR